MTVSLRFLVHCGELDRLKPMALPWTQGDMRLSAHRPGYYVA